MIFSGSHENSGLIASTIGAAVATSVSSLWANLTDDTLAWVTVIASIIWTACNLIVLVGRKIQDFRRDDADRWHALETKWEQQHNVTRTEITDTAGHQLTTPDPDKKSGGSSAG
jgi:uncharacterized membrane protein YeaQ/YmgE (transglycosylase-associated protein family)